MPDANKVISLIGKGLFVPASLLLLLQAAAVRRVSVSEGDFPIPALRQLPIELGNWRSPAEQSLEENVAAYLKPDDYILRDYGRPGEAPINVFVAYFKSLQNAYGPHSPKVCLPGSGWLVRSSKIATIQLPGRNEPTPTNEYFLDKGQDRILVIYWYQNNRNIWAEEFQAKLTMLPDLIRYRRSDASLVRLITPVQSSDGEPELAKITGFAKLMFPPLVERFQATQ